MKCAQSIGIDNGFYALRTGINAGGNQLVLFCDRNNLSYFIRAVGWGNGGSLVKPSRRGFRTFADISTCHRHKVRIRLLHPGNTLSGLHRALQALIVKTVRGGTRRLAIKRHADGGNLIYLSNVLMDSIVGKASKRKICGGEEYFDLRN